jgi:hypothetical protein
MQPSQTLWFVQTSTYTVIFTSCATFSVMIRFFKSYWHIPSSVTPRIAPAEEFLGFIPQPGEPSGECSNHLCSNWGRIKWWRQQGDIWTEGNNCQEIEGSLQDLAGFEKWPMVRSLPDHYGQVPGQANRVHCCCWFVLFAFLNPASPTQCWRH